jgi:hypothetical protein
VLSRRCTSMKGKLMQDLCSFVTHKTMLHDLTLLAKEANEARRQAILKLLAVERARDMSNEWAPWQEADGP